MGMFLIIEQYSILLLIILVKSTIEIYQGDSLPLKRYQELNYQDFKFNSDGRRLNKRHASVIDAPILQTNRLYFTAFNKRFSLILKRDTNLVANNFDIEVRYPSSGRPTEYIGDFFTPNYYTGIVEDEPVSHVICYFEMRSSQLAEPLIYAQISIKNERENSLYYVEPILNSTIVSKYIVYRSDEILSDVISNGVFNQTVCQPKYVNNISYVMPQDLLSFKRNKRQVMSQKENLNAKKNRCYLALVADHRFYKEIGNSDIKLTSAYLMNVIAAINSIYTRTPWIIRRDDEDDEIWFSYGFSVEKIIIFKEPTIDKYEHYNNPNSSLDADKILELFGHEDWTSYCLAHLFTFQNFQNSVLGLAYVSSPLHYTLGGICSAPTTRPKTSGSSGLFSVNTGLSSYKSVSVRQGRLLQREAELVTAHEFGHNWGSEHDPMKPECTPSLGQGGNFIMYAFSNQGYEPNNYNFSPCSINSIGEVLKTKSKCFKIESQSYCGNDRIESLEECDGGLLGRQGLDKCCDFNCKLRPNAVCSDSNHYCCKDCQIAPKGFKCYSSLNYIECYKEHSYCDGVSKECPSQELKPENTTCHSVDKGKCSSTGQCLSLCQQVSTKLFQCKCPQQDEKCMICCRNLSVSSSNQTDDECIPIHRLFPSKWKSPYYLSDGRACFDGLCENGVCQQRVKDYVSRFWKVIQTVTVSGFVEFMKRNIVGSIIILSLTFWVPFSCCIHFCIDKKYRSLQKKAISERMKQIYSYQPIETENIDDPEFFDRNRMRTSFRNTKL